MTYPTAIPSFLHIPYWGMGENGFAGFANIDSCPAWNTIQRVVLPERFSRCKKRLIFLRNCGNPRLICATQAGAKLRTWLSRPPTRSSHFGHNSPRLPSTLQSSAKRTKIKASLHANRVSDLRPEFVPLSPEWTPWVAQLFNYGLAQQA